MIDELGEIILVLLFLKFKNIVVVILVIVEFLGLGDALAVVPNMLEHIQRYYIFIDG